MAANRTWKLDDSDGALTLHTDVAGRAARIGHRLTIVMHSWQIRVDWNDQVPVSAELTVDVDSLQVAAGEGGVTPLTTPEKAVARGNALKTLGVKRFPHITFRADTFTTTTDGYRMHGPLQIHGVTRPTDVDLTLSADGEVWKLAAEAEVKQSDFAIKPYSMALGSMKVADTVAISFAAQYPEAGR